MIIARNKTTSTNKKYEYREGNFRDCGGKNEASYEQQSN